MSRPPFLSKASPAQSERTCSALKSLFLSCAHSAKLLIPRGTFFFPPDPGFWGETPPIIQTGERGSRGNCGQLCIRCPSTVRLPISRCLLRALSCDAGWIRSTCLFQVLSLNCSAVPGLKTTCYVACLPPVSTEPSREPPTACGKNSLDVSFRFVLFLVLEKEPGVLCELECPSTTETHHRGVFGGCSLPEPPWGAQVPFSPTLPLHPESLGLILSLIVYNTTRQKENVKDGPEITKTQKPSVDNI